jgi:hypothetical protein
MPAEYPSSTSGNFVGSDDFYRGGGGDDASAIEPQNPDQTVETLKAELDALRMQETGLPHRWVVVIAMIAAFVLCNMDKVRNRVSLKPALLVCRMRPAPTLISSRSSSWNVQPVELYAAVCQSPSK